MMVVSNLYNNSCRQNYSYFTTGNYLRTCYHCTAILDFPIAILAFYCILKVTPKRMMSMKWVLLNSHIWTTNLDLVLTILSGPYIFFPSASGLPLGILGDLGVGVKWQSYWGQVSVTFIGISVVMLYENRQCQIYTINYKMTRKTTRYLYYGFNFLVSLTIMLPFYLDETDQVELRKIVLDRIPCPIIEFFDPKNYVLLKGDETVPFYSIIISTWMLMGQVFFYSGRTVYHLAFVTNTKISASTRKMQKQYFGSVSIQILIPTIVIFLPILYSLYADKNNYYNQAYNNNALCMMANHGALSAFSTLMIYTPYREFCGSLFLGRRYERKLSTSVFVADMTTKLNN